MARRFLSFCFAVLAGVAVLNLALQLLSQFWGWLVLLALVVVAIYAAVQLLRIRRNRW